MNRPQQRPTFEFQVPIAADAVSERIIEGLQKGECPCVGAVRKRHAWIHIREEERRFWSPTLDLTLVEEEGVTRLKGRFGPHPNVWALFTFIYAFLSANAVLLSMYGLAQLTLDRTPWALLASAGLVALIGFVYGAAFIGQGLGHPEIVNIRIFLDRAVGRIGKADTAPASTLPPVDDPAEPAAPKA